MPDPTGGGHITVGRRGVQAMSIFCTNSWPGVLHEVHLALGESLGGAVCHVRRPGCTEVKSYSKHWTCLFPQHGPGRKHTRPIVLQPWQQVVVDAQAGLFLRGLFHSDGCRIGIPYRMPRPNTLSIARRAAVAALDAHVGPKY